MKSSFILYVLIMFIASGTNITYARDCISHSQCNQGEYCKGDGESVPTCRDCDEECDWNPLVNWICEAACYTDNTSSDCDSLQTVGVCESGTVIFQHANYEGSSQGLSLGRYDLSSLSIGNDTLSSLKVPNGWKVTLYRDHHFTGYTKVFTANTPFVGGDFNDQTSSIVVDD
ncbi:MAG: hypothetical protein KZQ99_22880 [Candidatus Thiodiazotropha sp. (ex Dulcina madagascariensis)]|nr:hypothetical protein [Candidatus Thiodiazotropha sp. (ex Dulcina madagascariensis)]